MMEIMADLKKEFDTTVASIKRVQDFAKKLLPYNSSVNIFFMELFLGDLLYGKTIIDYTPVLGCSELVKSESGKLGFHFRESPQERAISRWRDGDFVEAEKELAQIWRNYTTQKELLENLKESLKDKIKIPENFNSIEELNIHVNNLHDNPNTQEEILIFLISEFGVSAENASQIFFRWSQSNSKNVKSFAPYAYFCGKVKLLFELSLRFNLVGTRPTNIVDLQYLFYLPFTKLFASSDKFHILLAPYLLDSKQDFIDGRELKNDLKRLNEYRDSLSDVNDIKRTQNEPPQLPDSLTYKIWHKYFYWPSKHNRIDIKGPDNYKEIMNEFISAKRTNTDLFNKKDGIEFIVKEHNLKLTDLCICGSGKLFKDCCYTKGHYNDH